MKTIEQMAVEAGLGMETEAGFTSWPDMVPLKEWAELERFAALVRADEREKFAARIAELETAIRDASDWIEAGEGVTLTYYASKGDEVSVAVIDALVEKP